MVYVCMLSDKWLSTYGFVENYTAEILHFGGVLEFDLYPHPRYETWGPMSWNGS